MNAAGSAACYAVIFTSQRNGVDEVGYEVTAQRMIELAKAQPGFIDVESARNPDGLGITVSYWRTVEDIKAWKTDTEHLLAQKEGRTKWYSSFKTKICKVEREYSFVASETAGRLAPLILEGSFETNSDG